MTAVKNHDARTAPPGCIVAIDALRRERRARRGAGPRGAPGRRAGGAGRAGVSNFDI